MKSASLRKALVVAMLTVSIGQVAAYASGVTGTGYASFFGIPLWSTPLSSSPWWSTPWWSSPYGSTPYDSTDPGGGEDPVLPMSLADGIPAGWARGPVRVELLKAGSTDYLYYTIDGVGPQGYTDPIEITAEGRTTLEYWGVFQDILIEYPHNLADVLIDSTAPVVLPSIGGATAGTSRVTLSASDPLPFGVSENSGVDVETVSYKVGSGPITKYEGPFTVVDGSVVSYWASDLAGNSSAPASLQVGTDVAPPSVSAAVAPDPNAAGWRRVPASVTLSASDALDSTPSIAYRIGDGGTVAYAGPFAVAEGVVAVTYWATDDAGNVSTPKQVTVKSDGTAPSVPADLMWSSITPSSVTLSWAAATDSGAGIGFYELYRNGAHVSNATGTSSLVSGLTPGASYDFQVLAVDAAGNRSALSAVKTVAMPVVGQNVEVPTTGPVSTTVPVGGVGDVDVSFENVTAPGTLTVTVTDAPPAGPESTYRFMGVYFDVSFSGTWAPGSRITIVMPYDPSIPDARARNLKVKHWTSTGWETITPVVDTVAHTVTFTVTSLSPFAYAEPAAVDSSTRLTAGFGSAANTRSELVVGYGKTATLVGRLADADGNALPKPVIVEYWNRVLNTWVRLGDAAPTATPGEYQYTVKTADRTSYRMRFAGDAYNTASESATRIVYPRTYTGTPKAPKTMSRSKYYNVYGYLKPRHTSGTYPVRIYKWRYVSGKWKSYGYVKAKATNYTSSTGAKYSKYSRKIKLPYKGTWKLRAYAPKDGLHAGTWSASYDKVKVN